MTGISEVQNIYTSHNFSLFAIFSPNIIKIGENLTKFWQKQIYTVFLRHGVIWPNIFNFWHSGTLALCPERQSARMSKIKNGGLDQYGSEHSKV